MSISYRSLEIFTKVYEKRNMTLAAEGLFISQPSVSLAIRELETQYDTPLFERFPRELRPTAKGDMLYHYAKQLLQLQKEVDFRMQSEEDEITFTIGANISVGVVLIHNYLELIREMNLI